MQIERSWKLIKFGRKIIEKRILLSNIKPQCDKISRVFKIKQNIWFQNIAILARIEKNVSETNPEKMSRNGTTISIDLTRNTFRDRFPLPFHPMIHLSPLICILDFCVTAVICKWAAHMEWIQNNFHRIVYTNGSMENLSTNSYSPPCFRELNKFRWKIGFAIFINFYSAYFFPLRQFFSFFLFSIASRRWPLRRAEISNIFSTLSTILVFTNPWRHGSLLLGWVR